MMSEGCVYIRRIVIALANKAQKTESGKFSGDTGFVIHFHVY